ncbi:MAG: GNAT family N-acetyltransferase [Thermodesulfobacteria bacterium]|nr:GNAT family N-acetyltransferase [Thermodesulfobacteriota bacterium]
MHGFILRRVEPADIEAIHRIEEECQFRPWPTAGFEFHLAQERSTRFWCLCPKDNRERIVGYICFRILFEECYLLNIAVDKDYWGRGLGSFMLKCLLTYARRRGAKKVVLDVYKDNFLAISFYQSHGFSFVCNPRRVKGEFCVMEMKSLSQ